MRLSYTTEFEVYRLGEDAVYTVLCALPSTPRGTYDEELDVLVRNGAGRRVNMAEVRRTAQDTIDRDYANGLKIKRIVRGGL